MPKIHPKAEELIDRYIDSIEPFAQPICRRLRALIHKAEPEIIEDWKWGPNFNKDGMVCGFGAFKEFVSIAFFMGALLKDPKKTLIDCSGSNAEKALLAFVKEAVALNEKGVKPPRAARNLRCRRN